MERHGVRNVGRRWRARNFIRHVVLNFRHGVLD
jgi:hypothetical protein